MTEMLFTQVNYTVGALVDFIKLGQTRQVTIEELARKTGMSVSAFKREFRGAFDASPREWMTQRRLDRARHLLARADRNVTEVSLEVGFESVSHFIQRFRRRFAVTPKQFQMSQSRRNPTRAR